jgi:RNA polymerase sigma-70 factor (ECF subfamily)
MNTKIIWTDFSAALHRFIAKKVKDIAVADDLLQEVFIKIHLQKETLQKKDRLKSWIFTIANNTVNDYFRKKQKETHLLENKKLTDTEETLIYCPQDCLLPLIKNLPDIYREVLCLSEIKGYKQKEVAQQLNISLPATKSRILRGRDLLKKGFMDCCDYKLDEKGHLRGEHKNKVNCKVCN